MNAPLPANETARLETLHASGLLDTLPEQAYDDITLLASQICQTPIAYMSLVDEKRQWFKSKVGLEANEIPREHSFCAHAMLEPQSLLIVPNAQVDSRFADNPAVVGELNVRFYAGAPLVTPEGHALGSLCVVDKAPRQLSESQLSALQALSRQVMAQFTLHQQARQMKALNAQLERLSVRDELTGLHNRRAFNSALYRELGRAKRYSSPLSLVLLDVDRFKSYNDSFGHLAGDEVLRQVGQVLLAHLEKQSGDMVVAARYGGEEFALILPDTLQQVALRIAEEVRLALQERSWPKRAITASLGVATTTLYLNSEDELIAAADAALYASKSAGRNRVTHSQSLR